MIKKLINKESDKFIGKRMLNFAKKLYPHNRSLMGPDIRYSLQKFIEINPDFKEMKFNTGEKVFDWEIPEEWIIKDAYIEHENGEKFGEFKKCNLHLMGYSIPINKIMTKKEFTIDFLCFIKKKNILLLQMKFCLYM